MYNFVEKMQNLPPYKGALGSSASFLSFAVSKATQVELLQVVTLYVGAVTGLLTLVSIVLSIDKKLRDRRRDIDEDTRKIKRRRPSNRCLALPIAAALIFSSCATVPRNPVPDTQVVREHASRIIEHTSTAARKTQQAKDKVEKLRAATPSPELDQLNLDLGDALTALRLGEESGYFLAGGLTALDSNIQRLAKERDTFREKYDKMRPARDRWRKAALLAAAFSGALLVWIFRRPLLSLIRLI